MDSMRHPVAIHKQIQWMGTENNLVLAATFKEKAHVTTN